MRRDTPKLEQREVLADAVPRAEREWNERVRVVRELRRVRLQALRDEPAVREEFVRVREVPRVAVEGPEMYAYCRVLRYVAAAVW